MRIFLSWSGPNSHALARVLYEWLPNVIQQVDPWLSSETIEKGTPWLREINAALQVDYFGIICIVPGNQTSPWLNYEAGALAAKGDASRVCTVLLGLGNADVTGPLSTFQSTVLAEKEEVFKLVSDINGSLGLSTLPAGRLRHVFEREWTDLSGRLAGLATDFAPDDAKADQRSDRAVLEDVLETVRALRAQNVASSPLTRQDPASARLKDGNSVWIGSTVLHDAYGSGEVTRIVQPLGAEDKTVLHVTFATGEQKRFLVKYAPLVAEEPPF